MPEQIVVPEVDEPVSTEPLVEETYEDIPDLTIPEDDSEAEPEPENEPEKPTVESIAAELGWKPKDGFAGNDEDYVDAAEYIRRSKNIQESMRTSLKENKRKLAQMDKMVQDLKAHTQAVLKSEVRDLKARVEAAQKARDEAIEEGDKEQVYAIEKELSELKTEVESHLTRTMKEKEAVPEFDEREVENFVGWTKANPWYKAPGKEGGDTEMSRYADYLADLAEYRGLPYERKLMAVTEIVKQKFSDKFSGNKPPAPRVEGGKPSPMKKTYSVRDLSQEQREIMRNFVRQGVMSEKDYINDLVKIGEIGR